ncbi:SIR2 family protein [Peptoniphilus hominis (ex Hitch et al. 2025)]|uniref:SIR2 family protein n=1 Tax=Peptoniphilus hominis (ex Hitch et al. 2025) TaxID=3133174 RepID=A0ABV1CG40_9FIRM
MKVNEFKDVFSEESYMDSDKLDELIRGKSINFLIGAGASVPIYPTLSFGEGYPSFEDIVSNSMLYQDSKTFMYIFYFMKWIKQMGINSEEFVKLYSNHEVFINYKKLVKCIYEFLQTESNEVPKRVNIFTTNYDLLFERAFDEFLFNNPLIYFNDGSRGFFNKSINNKNFYLNVTHSGYNDNYRREVPTINLFKLHGSLSWKLEDNRILVNENNYLIDDIKQIIDNLNLDTIKIENIFNECISTDTFEFIQKLNMKIKAENMRRDLLDNFFYQYSKLPIINPNKYKFFKTVSEQHYYQLIRSFSYELERKQAILIVFGFSFADEHIKDIFERSLLNPELQVILISYSKSGQKYLKSIFGGYKNIIFLPEKFENNNGDFKYLLSLLGEIN